MKAFWKKWFDGLSEVNQEEQKKCDDLLQEARRTLEEVKRLQPEVTEMGRVSRELRMRNHFAEIILKAMRKP